MPQLKSQLWTRARAPFCLGYNKLMDFRHIDGRPTREQRQKRTRALSRPTDVGKNMRESLRFTLTHCEGCRTFGAKPNA